MVRDGREEASGEGVVEVLEELEVIRRSVSAAEHLSLSDFLLGLPQSVERGGPGELHGAVSLLTYHQAKGLEFEVVFLIGLEEGIFPDFRSVRDLRRMEEERRLFYVGITRTKGVLYLTLSRQRTTVKGTNWARDASPFIAEIPPNLTRRIGR